MVVRYWGQVRNAEVYIGMAGTALFDNPQAAENYRVLLLKRDPLGNEELRVCHVSITVREV